MDAQALQQDPRSWLNRNRWRIGMAVAAILGGYWWHRAGRNERISVGSVSERWLAEQAFDSGQHPDE
jgi:hypothetical protein